MTFIHDLFAFFAIINPFSTLPIFLAMTPTNEYDERERKRIATKAVIAAFIITTVFLFLGHYNHCCTDGYQRSHTSDSWDVVYRGKF